MEQWLAGLEMGRPCFNSWQLGFPNCMEYPSFCHPPLAHGQCRGSLPQGPSCCCSWESAIVLQTQTEQLLRLCCPYSTAQLISNRLTYFFDFVSPSCPRNPEMQPRCPEDMSHALTRIGRWWFGNRPI